MLQGVKTQFFPAGPRKKSDLVQLEKIEFLPPRAKKLGSFLAGLSKIFSLLTIWPIFFWVNRVKKDVKNSQMEPFSRGIFTLRTWQNLYSIKIPFWLEIMDREELFKALFKCNEKGEQKFVNFSQLTPVCKRMIFLVIH